MYQEKVVRSLNYQSTGSQVRVAFGIEKTCSATAVHLTLSSSPSLVKSERVDVIEEKLGMNLL